MYYIQCEISDKIAIITITAPKSLEFDLSEEKETRESHNAILPVEKGTNLTVN